MAIRSFLAFDLPEDIKKVVSRTSEELTRRPLKVRWVDPGKIHLTIVFLGDVEEARLDQIGNVVDEICKGYRDFNMGLNGAGFFGTIKNPRVIWLGLKGDVDRMGALRNSLQKALGPFGIKEENRPFRPHITLGRFKQDAAGGEELRRIMDSYKNITSPMCVMSELVLYRSELRPSGPVYTVLRRYRFTGQL